MSMFNLTGYFYRQDINIMATVVEEGTGKWDAPRFIKKRERKRVGQERDPV